MFNVSKAVDKLEDISSKDPRPYEAPTARAVYALIKQVFLAGNTDEVPAHVCTDLCCAVCHPEVWNKPVTDEKPIGFVHNDLIGMPNKPSGCGHHYKLIKELGVYSNVCSKCGEVNVNIP